MSEPETRPTGLLYTDGQSGLLRLRRYLVRVVEGPDRGLSYTLESGTAMLGTHPHNDIVLSDGTVSRYHLEIQVRADGIRVSDLDSTNGTYMGDTRLGSVVVRGRTRLRVGGETLLEVLPADEAVPMVPFESAFFGRAYGQSPAMTALFSLLARVAPSEATVLLCGETGTGKELLAEAVHQASPRASGPFVIVDCGAIPRELMAAELFGHSRGAFTGAIQAKQGLAESASGGTLFLDEVGELPLELQPHLLRLLEKREVRPIGETRPRRVDVRVVAATHRDLRAMVHEGRFREDLYYRLAVVTVEVPPLRSRPEDIVGLVQLMLEEIGRPDFVVTDSIIQSLTAHTWPGNVRELRNVVERGLSLATGAIHVPRELQTREADPAGLVSDEVMERPFKEAKGALVEAFEREYLERLLMRHKGNISQAAQEAGIDRNYIHRLVKRYRLTIPGR